jgi:hypothetical protein
MSRATTIEHDLDVPTLLARTGWHVEDRGACRGDVCVPLPERSDDPAALAGALAIGLAHDDERGVWAIGPDARTNTLTSAALPDLTLPTRDGAPFALPSLVGRRGVLLAWASW